MLAHKKVAICSITIALLSWSYNLQAYFYKDWCQIQTEHFTILFRKNIYREAQRMANTLEAIYEPVYRSLGSPPKNTLLIINNQLFYSNGFAFPGSMVFYTLPPQDDSNTDWLLHLAIHELRHIAQFSAIWGKFLIPYHTIPTQPWFFEGDAVVMETSLCDSGRGRLPSFSLLYRTNLLEGKKYSYSKQALGSMKDRIPDHYKIGYFMISFLRKTYGENFLKKILEKGKMFKSLGLKVKQLTNKSLEELYEETNDDLLQLWQSQLEGLKITPAASIAQTKTIDHDDYYFPHTIDTGDCIAFKVGTSTNGTFVRIDKTGKETYIFEPRTNSPQCYGFSVSNSTIAWAEPTPDPLWGSRGVSYSVIQLYDMITKKLTTINHKSRYISAQLSQDGKQIMVVESDESYNHSILIFNTADGELLNRIYTNDNQFLKHPRWSHDNKKIVAIATKDNTCSIILIDLNNNNINNVIPYTSEHISYPILCDNYIIYNSAYSGIDNIYALDINTHKRYQITCRSYGAYNASISHDKMWIYFSDFTKNGMQIARMPFDPSSWKPIEEVENRSINYCDAAVKQEASVDILKNIPSKNYDMYEYPILKNALTNWGISPIASIMEFGEKKAGIVISSSDYLGALVFKSGVYYDIAKNTVAVPFKIIHKGWYPIVKLHCKYEYPISKEDPKKFPSQISSREEYSKLIAKLARNSVGFNITLPLSLPLYSYNTKFKIKIGTSLEYEPATRNLWVPQEYKLSIHKEKKTRYRDINPTSSDLKYQLIHTPYKGDITGYSSTIVGRCYLPGLAKHHSFGIKVSIHKSTNKRILSKLTKPIASTSLLKDPKYNQTLSTTCLEYALPILYIDSGYGDTIFFKRLYINFLLEYLHLHQLAAKFYNHPITIGTELMVNTSVINLPISLGVRFTYTIAVDELNNKKNDWGIDYVLNMKFL
jgi:hypothetical protein